MKVDSGSSSQIVVEFQHQGETLRRTVYASLFHSYSQGLRGQDILVLFDPANPGLVRTASRNMHDMTWAATLSAAVAALIGVASIRQSRRVLSHLDRADWLPGALDAGGRTMRKQAKATLHLANSRRVTARNIDGLGWRQYFRSQAHYVVDGKFTIVIVRGSGKAIVLRTFR